MSDTVIVNEVGLRDGLQNQPVTVDTDTKARLARLLVDAGVRYLEPVSFVSPKAIPQMADAAALTPRLPADEGLHYTALVPNLKGYQLARDAGYRTVALVLSTTDTFNQRNLNMSLEQADGLMRDGTISGGMIPKLETCLAAVRGGVRAATILDGRLPHVLLVETFTEAGIGTMIEAA